MSQCRQIEESNKYFDKCVFMQYSEVVEYEAPTVPNYLI